MEVQKLIDLKRRENFAKNIKKFPKTLAIYLKIYYNIFIVN
jgi:hypothetical protein